MDLWVHVACDLWRSSHREFFCCATGLMLKKLLHNSVRAEWSPDACIYLFAGPCTLYRPVCIPINASSPVPKKNVTVYYYQNNLLLHLGKGPDRASHFSKCMNQVPQLSSDILTTLRAFPLGFCGKMGAYGGLCALHFLQVD